MSGCVRSALEVLKLMDRQGKEQEAAATAVREVERARHALSASKERQKKSQLAAKAKAEAVVARNGRWPKSRGTDAYMRRL